MQQLKLIPAADHHENGIYQRLVSEDARPDEHPFGRGKIELGIHPVMFGYRVRAGYVGDYGVYIDWCGGADQGQVELLYSLAKNILENHGSFKGVPERSEIKPFFNDPEFLEKVYSLVQMPLEIIKLKPLELDRDHMLNQHLKF